VPKGNLQLPAEHNNLPLISSKQDYCGRPSRVQGYALTFSPNDSKLFLRAVLGLQNFLNS